MVCKNVWLSSVELSQDTWPWPARKIFQINTGIWCGNDAVVQQWILWILISSEIFQQQKTMSSETSSTGSLVSPESGSKSRRQTKWQFLKINKEPELEMDSTLSQSWVEFWNWIFNRIQQNRVTPSPRV